MRVLLTTLRDHEGADGGTETDVVVEAEPGATVDDLAAVLGSPIAGLDPTAPLIDSGLLDGAVIRLEPRLGSDQDPGADPDESGAASMDPAVELRITGGLGAGTVFRLEPGEYLVGSSPGCQVVLPDPDLPALCLVLTVGRGQVRLAPAAETIGSTRSAPPRSDGSPGPIVVSSRAVVVPRRPRGPLPDGVVTVDPAADIPLLHLGRVPISESRSWARGEQLAVGRLLLELADPTRPDASLSPTPGGGTLDINRPPRMARPDRPTAFTLPRPPRPPERLPFPLLVMLAPAALGTLMFLVTRTLLSLAFLALSPLLALSQVTTGRRQQRQRHHRELREYVDRTTRIQADALTALTGEQAGRRDDHPDPARLLATTTAPGSRLWERRPGDPDFLTVRVGTADLPSQVTVSTPGDLAGETTVLPSSWTAPDVPACIDLSRIGVTGVCGPGATTVGRWILAQSAALHSPDDVVLSIWGGRSRIADWRWAGWLPHARRVEGSPGAASRVLLADRADRADLPGAVTALSDLVDRRHALRDTERTGLSTWLVVLDGARELRMLSGVPRLLADGPAVGVLFLCLDRDRRSLPRECRAVVRAGASYLSLERSGLPLIEGVRPDGVSPAWSEVLARGLAPIRDVGGGAGATLPTSLRLPDLLGIEPDPATIAARWRQEPRSTRALIGIAEDGPFAVDLAADGPHALIAGTTGAGKSELLQTLICSLALGNRPDELSFVLVDYKGGAAFRDCARLPHTAGVVTDLDAGLTERALASLTAELRRRERVLAEAGARDLDDFPRTRPGRLPRLMIVIDEFATLSAELPDFVSGLVDIARRGRSLGVHLVLATQRPAGVIGPEIRANTTLRIALRVTDPGDSDDVIDSPSAVLISAELPGRALARLGHGRLIGFQCGRVSGPAPDGRRPPVRVRPLHGSGSTSDATEDDLGILGARTTDPTATDPAATDLAVLVETMRTAAAGIDLPASPWLPPLPAVVTLAGLAPAQPWQVPFGLLDDPEAQSQRPAVWDLTSEGHLGVVGGPRSGRSTLLRTLAGSIAARLGIGDVQLHALDCGTDALLPLLALPQVGVVATRTETERIRRLLRRLAELVAHRQRLLATEGYADLAEHRARADRPLPYVVLLVDGWEGFHQLFDGLDGGQAILDLQHLLREGRSVGLRVAVAGDRSLLVGRMASLLDDKLVLRMTDPGDLATIGVARRRTPSTWEAGRCFRATDRRELQVALLDPDPSGPSQVAALQELARTVLRHRDDAEPPFRLDVLPQRVDRAGIAGLPCEPGLIPVGVGGDELSVLGFDPLRDGSGLLVAGPRGSGRSTTLLALGRFAADAGWGVIGIAPRVSPLRDHDSPCLLVADETDDESEVGTVVERLIHDQAPLLMLVDDLELLDVDGWLAGLVARMLARLRDTGSLVAAGATPVELSGLYRGPALALRRAGTGVLLSPRSSADADLLGVRLPRSAYGESSPPGRGWLVRDGRPERIQTIWPG